MCESDVFSIDDGWLAGVGLRFRPASPALPTPAFSVPSFPPRPPDQWNRATLEEIERGAILGALRSTSGMVGGANGAAAILGLKRTTLQARMQRLGIAPGRPAFTGAESGAERERYPMQSAR